MYLHPPSNDHCLLPSMHINLSNARTGKIRWNLPESSGKMPLVIDAASLSMI
jgi:hypothetical protein